MVAKPIQVVRNSFCGEHKMKYETIEVNVSTNETKIVKVVLSESEIEEGERIRLERQAELDAAVAAKEAVLNRVGLTAEEAALLLS